MDLESARKERHADALAGMDDRRAALSLGTGIRYSGLGFSAMLSGTKLLKRDGGWKGRFGLGYERRFGDRWLGMVQTAAYFSDDENTGYEFGITPAQAQRRGSLLASGDRRLRPGDEKIFSPQAGLSSIRTGLVLTRIVDQHWRWMGAISFSELQGDARRSPLVRRPSNTAAALGLLYQFQ